MGKRDDWRDDKHSKYLKIAFSGFLDDFNDTYPDNEACRIALLEARGWRESKGGMLKYKCLNPQCESNAAIKRKRKYFRKAKEFEDPGDREMSRISYRCVNSKCRKEVNAASGTLFGGNETNLYLWFLTLHCMALLGGKLPRVLIVKAYYEYIVNDCEYAHTQWSDDLRYKAYKNIQARVYRVNRKLGQLFRKGNSSERYKHYKYIGYDMRYKSTYLDWYRARRSGIVGFMISWTPGPCSVDNNVANFIARNSRRKEVADVQYIKKYEKGLTGNWVLCFQIKSGKVKNIRWIRVDGVYEVVFPIENPAINESEVETLKREKQRVRKEKFSSYQLVQIEPRPNLLNRPFRLTNKFYSVLRKAVKKFGVKKLKTHNDNNVLNCPEEILHTIALGMGEGVCINEEITGSW